MDPSNWCGSVDPWSPYVGPMSREGRGRNQRAKIDEIRIVVDLLGYFYGKFMEKIGLKALGNYYASI